jgi:hypothetical protein
LFADGSSIRVSLTDTDRVDPEAVRLQLENGQWWMW